MGRVHLPKARTGPTRCPWRGPVLITTSGWIKTNKIVKFSSISYRWDLLPISSPTRAEQKYNSSSHCISGFAHIFLCWRSKLRRARKEYTHTADRPIPTHTGCTHEGRNVRYQTHLAYDLGGSAKIRSIPETCLCNLRRK